MNIKIPQDVQRTISILEQNNHSAYVVGGCVRDMVLGITPHDYDICTSATPDEMKEAFGEYDIIETGLKHGTITVKGLDDFYEVTTYRIDGEYKDNRHPENVVFVDNIEEDLARRDFTINAMAYNKKTGLIDPFGGRKDLENKIIRCVGNPDKRFQEDALRILRCLRFASRFCFDIEENTKNAIFRNKDLLQNISKERINNEFVKILQNADFKMLNEYKDILAVFIPEIKDTFYFEQNNYHHKYNVYEHMMHAVDYSNDDIYVKLALFLHDIGKPSVYTVDDNGVGHFYGHAVVSGEMAEQILKRLKFDNDTIEKVTTLIINHDLEPQPSEKFARKILKNLGYEQAKRLIEIERCDKMAQTVNKDSLKTNQNLTVLSYNIENIIERNECFSIKDLAVNGNDLIKEGIPQGVILGNILKKLLENVIENPNENNKEHLILLAKEMYDNISEMKNHR